MAWRSVCSKRISNSHRVLLKWASLHVLDVLVVIQLKSRTFVGVGIKRNGKRARARKSYIHDVVVHIQEGHARDRLTVSDDRHFRTRHENNNVDVAVRMAEMDSHHISLSVIP